MKVRARVVADSSLMLTLTCMAANVYDVTQGYGLLHGGSAKRLEATGAD